VPFFATIFISQLYCNSTKNSKKVSKSSYTRNKSPQKFPEVNIANIFSELRLSVSIAEVFVIENIARLGTLRECVCVRIKTPDNDNCDSRWLYQQLFFTLLAIMDLFLLSVVFFSCCWTKLQLAFCSMTTKTYCGVTQDWNCFHVTRFLLFSKEDPQNEIWASNNHQEMNIRCNRQIY
jgi:hypothetical protein